MIDKEGVCFVLLRQSLYSVAHNDLKITVILCVLGLQMGANTSGKEFRN